jgi:FlaA1/EpsC-like NDP-sugar epimerase
VFNKISRWFEEPPVLSRGARILLIMSMHSALFTAAFVGSFLLRFDDMALLQVWLPAMWRALPLVLVCKLSVFALMRMYQGWWRYVSLYDLVSLVRALAVAGAVVIMANVLGDVVRLPRSIYILDYGLSLVLLGGARGSLRLLREAMRSWGTRVGTERLLILGAGDTGETLLREINKNPNLPYHPVGFLDDDATKHGLRIQNVPVLGPIEALPELVKRHNITRLIIAMPSASREQLRRVLELAQPTKLDTKIIPAVEDILAGGSTLNQIREVSISDLLGRDAVELDNRAIADFIQDRVVLVTGAGGSIGSEICRQVARFAPAKLVLVERGETPLFFIHNELVKVLGDRVSPQLADITNAEQMRSIFQQFKPDIVLHAAAFKHVPMMELHPCEAVKNNVIGTRTVADLAVEHEVDTFLLISTDKAVNPTSVMGATKRVTELYVRGLQARQGDEHKTKFCVVRFGNVLGSNGSVVPIFREQIKNGGPVTVTHPEMTRFFMTIPEASQLVLQAATQGAGGEVFILDMGEPVKILDLARDMIRLSGFTEEDIKIVFSGLRPGEKLYEELSLDEEEVDTTRHKKIFVARKGVPDYATIKEDLEGLIEAGLSGQALEVRRYLMRLIPSYKQPKIPDNVVSLRDSKRLTPLGTVRPDHASNAASNANK